MPVAIKNFFTLFTAFSLMLVCGIPALMLRVASFGALTDFNRKYFIPISSRLIMKLVGMEMRLPKPYLQERSFITFNHNSYLDVFALTAMGLTGTRILLSEKTLRIVPLTISALAIGVLYIPVQSSRRRLGFFKKLEKRIQKENIHIMASSEGVHEHFHGIARFNRGVYHIATVCHMPIVPVFISLPEESNPFSRYKYFKKGTLSVELLPVINTSGWRLADLDENKDRVRALFVNKFNEVHQTAIV